jgi:hypothetical protein
MVEVTANLTDEAIIETENAARLILEHVEVRPRGAIEIN